MRIELVLAASLVLAYPASGIAETLPGSEQMPGDLNEQVEEARRALARADFDRLVPLLRSAVSDEETQAPASAHILYALGLLFDARDEDLEGHRYRAESHIEKALEIEPQLELDPLLYPAEFIGQVEEIRARFSDPPEDQTTQYAVDGENFYFERYVETRSRWPLFLPFGAGQFYKDEAFRGVTFAAVQALGIGTNIVGYWVIESLRGPTGQFPTESIDSAQRWRRAQLGGLILFAAGWTLGALEANWNFEPRQVRIRTLDGPPEELHYPPGNSSLGQPLQLQWVLTF